MVERYVDALCNEIGHFGSASVDGAVDAVALTADTVYFGGGTPSLLLPEQVEKILNVIFEKFAISPDAEITMEMNPATVTPASLTEYRFLGVNRASFGVQTFNDRALKLLARGHDANDARNTFAMLRDAGFDNISFDLIAGLPAQTLDDWRTSLDEAITLNPEHISLYLLEIHDGTPLAEQVRSGRQPSPDDDLAAAMYELMLDRLTAAGYEQYEISNFSKPGYESRHNAKYWLLEPVYGFGVSAHSFDGHERYSNVRDTAKYVECIEKAGKAEVSRERIDEAAEFAFLGLRMEKGIGLAEYKTRFGSTLFTRYENELARFDEAGLIDLTGDRLRLTPKGKLFSNEVFQAFV